MSIVMLAAPSPVLAQTSAAPVPAINNAVKIDGLLKTYQECGQLNGSVLVAEKGKVILRKGYGMANMEWEIPNQPNTKFRIGSVTKQFTAALILQLVEAGKIQLDAPMTKYLPDYRKDTGDKISVHQLLNHTSGIPSYTTRNFFKNESRDSYSVDDFVKKFASGDLEFEPGSNFRYNNSAYYLLGAIIEKVTGKPYAKVLKERILDPVGMSDTGYDTHAPIIKNRAQGYRKTPRGYINANYLDMGLPFSAGSMYSTVDDLFKWDRALYGNDVLSDASKLLMFKPGRSDYGYGFFITERPIGKTGKHTKVIQHGGGINGFNSRLTRVVDQNHLIVILDNVGLGNYHNKITNSIINILNDQPFESPKKSIAEALHKTAIENGGAAAVAQYRTLKSEKANIYDFSDERALNAIGYVLMGKDKTKDAIEIFRLNVEMFPKSSNSFDSLGEAYLKNGQNKLALINYKKSLELDPENLTGAQAIKKLEGK